MIFPDTPLPYIRQRCVDLVGRPAAIDRFTEELLRDPQPPDNWETIYRQPFTIPENIASNTPPQAAPEDVVAEAPETEKLKKENSMTPVQDISDADSLAIAAALKDLNKQNTDSLESMAA